VSNIEMTRLLFWLHSKALESMLAESTSLKETQSKQSLSSQKQSICEETDNKISYPEHTNFLLLGVICAFTNDVLYTLKCCLKAYCIRVTTLTENLVIKIYAPLVMTLLQEGQPGARSSRLCRVRGRVRPLWILCTQPFPRAKRKKRTCAFRDI
jgi:hypothetical protein